MSTATTTTAPNTGNASACPPHGITRGIEGQPRKVKGTRLRRGREPTFKLDTDGAAIAVVPTSRPGRPVKMLAEDWHAYLAKGHSPFIFLNSNGKGLDYARVDWPGPGGNLAMVARLVLGTSGGAACIEYADGDRLNLRRDNLIVSAKVPWEAAARRVAA